MGFDDQVGRPPLARAMGGHDRRQPRLGPGGSGLDSSLSMGEPTHIPPAGGRATARATTVSCVKPDRIERRVQRRLAGLSLGARRELLRVLASPSNTRADLIRQMHERTDTRDLAEVLMDLESRPPLRLDVMEALKDSVKDPG